MLCAECGTQMVWDEDMGTMSTLIAPQRVGNCIHDDNCLTRRYVCANGHAVAVSLRRRCACGWAGKQSCFCHIGQKVDAWP